MKRKTSRRLPAHIAQLRRGDKVWLKAWTDPDDPYASEQRQRARVWRDPRLEDGVVSVVLDKQYRGPAEEDDDGFREVPFDQIEDSRHVKRRRKQ